RNAADLLLQRMNGVLRAAVTTNFGVRCDEAISALYESIDRVLPGMIARCEDLSLLYFARSFAVVLEEALRQLHRKDTV
ncbi:hypothetical protein PMAYCL1PPCAC_13784, partial [Pristionchus mayeri]